MTGQQAFDPSRYLTKVGGKDYLEVKWRLVWLREVDGQARIETQMIEHDFGHHAVFRAKISLSDGAEGTGWGSETPQDFRDYLEKAETKAIGRALASLGFGTQFCDDYHYETNPNRPVVDSPVDRAASRPSNPTPFPSNGNGNNRPATNSGDPMTDRQLKMIWFKAGEQGIDSAQIHAFIKHAYGTDTMDTLTKQNATALIDILVNNPQRVFNASVTVPANDDPYP